MTSALPSMDRAARWAKLREAMATASLDATLFSDAPALRYLCGFTGSAGQLLVTADAAVFTSDGRYSEQARSQLAQAALEQVEIVIDRPGGQDAAVATALGAGRVGIDPATVTWARAQEWIERLEGGDVVAVPDLLAPLRALKDDGEIARIEAAAGIADAALATCRPLLGDGVTEIEFALELDRTMLSTGAEELSFATICASGPNAALPHARPSDRRIVPGDLVVVDFGAVVDGYHSDMTRSFVIGDPDEQSAAMLDAVTEAQALGVAAVAPGRTCAEIDSVCRERLAEAGLAEEFVHGTGHGVGLVIHEAPWVNSTSDTELQVGHVVTVEPGVYRPGFGGVRVEDTVVVTPDGARPLTAAPKEPVIAG